MNHRSPRDGWGVVGTCLLAATTACAPARAAGSYQNPRSDTPPPLPAAPPAPLLEEYRHAAPGEDPLAAISALQTVTLRAQEVDVRALLMGLAEAADVSLVIDEGVEGRLSVHLVDVSVAEALRQVLASANLSVSTPRPAAPWGPVVFHVAPVDIEQVSAELIESRFGVSPAVARWIVESRAP